MKTTDVKIPALNWLAPNDRVAFLGSCFSVHMATSCENHGFSVLSNPFGVIFNPCSLARLILNTEKDWKNSIFTEEDKFLSWDAHSELWALSEKELTNQLITQQKKLYKHLKQSNTLFITFGTAWVYERETGIVANCHKRPQKEFTKRCISSDKIVTTWEKVVRKLKIINPSLKIVLTVSPVRHKRDGLVENNQSKAQLITAVHKLCASFDQLFYFPSYEIVIDELRDYAFFERDGVHPNRYCIEEVEQRFFESFLTDEGKEAIDAYKKMEKLCAHQPLHPGSSKARRFEEDRQRKLDDFVEKYPAFEHLIKKQKSRR